MTPPADTTGEPTTVVAIADAVRSGATSAAAVVESHLARIGAREADVHAFNLVLADEARAAAAALDERVARGEDPGPLAGVPIALKDNLCTRGIADHLLLPHPRGLATALRRHGRRAARRRGRGHRRQDEPRRVRHGLLDRELRLRPDPQPARPQPRARRLLGRQRGGGGGRIRAAGARFRHRRLHPPAGRPLRRRRRQADLRRRLPLRPGRLRVEPRPDRPARPHGRGRRPAPRGHRRPRPTGLHLGPAAGAGPLGPTLQDGVEGLRIGRITDLPAGADPEVADAPRGGVRRRSSGPARRSSTSPSPPSATASPPTT